MTAVPDHEQRIAAALCGAAAASPGHGRGHTSGPGAAHEMLAVAESIAARGGLDVDDLRQRQLAATSGTGLLLRALPFGLATPLDRPRLRHDAYRYASAAGADEGTALVCVAAALVAADLLRFDPVMTAIRVRQSLLEDAPMALLNRLTILEPESEMAALRPAPSDGPTPACTDLNTATDTASGTAAADTVSDTTPTAADAAADDPASDTTPTAADPAAADPATGTANAVSPADADPGAALQAALSVLAWTECAGVAAVLARVGSGGQDGVVSLAAALAGAASGACDVPVGEEFAERAGRVAAALAALAAAAVR